jgi:hypothetical protein
MTQKPSSSSGTKSLWHGTWCFESSIPTLLTVPRLLKNTAKPLIPAVVPKPTEKLLISFAASSCSSFPSSSSRVLGYIHVPQNSRFATPRERMNGWYLPVGMIGSSELYWIDRYFYFGALWSMMEYGNLVLVWDLYLMSARHSKLYVNYEQYFSASVYFKG